MKSEDTTKKVIMIVLVAGEILTVAAVILIYFFAKDYWSKFTGGTFLTVTLGSILGAATTIANQIIMFAAGERAFDKMAKERGNAEMTEEEIAKFKKDNEATFKNQMQVSFIARTAVIAAVFILAYFTKLFDILSLVIPLLMLKPLLLLSEVFQKKEGK